jgi:hypothetical protein
VRGVGNLSSLRLHRLDADPWFSLLIAFSCGFVDRVFGVQSKMIHETTQIIRASVLKARLNGVSAGSKWTICRRTL